VTAPRPSPGREGPCPRTDAPRASTSGHRAERRSRAGVSVSTDRGGRAVLAGDCVGLLKGTDQLGPPAVSGSDGRSGMRKPLAPWSAASPRPEDSSWCSPHTHVSLNGCRAGTTSAVVLLARSSSAGTVRRQDVEVSTPTLRGGLQRVDSQYIARRRWWARALLGSALSNGSGLSEPAQLDAMGISHCPRILTGPGIKRWRGRESPE
jgi:hypothetical protein